MKSDILRMLKEKGDFVSGQEICERFHVSRTAVWKAVNQLKEEGYDVEAVRNKGYRLISSPDVMTKEELESMIRTEWAGRKIVYFDTTDSTNMQAKKSAEGGERTGTLFVADTQQSGRGRRGRSWSSPKGSSISMTLLLRPEIAPSQAPMLTLVMALAVCRTLQQTGLPVQIKWPNDIICGGRKLVGILTEMSTEIDYINYVVIGVGINVNVKQFPEDLKEKATSILIEKKMTEEVRRAPIITGVMEEFEQLYHSFISDGDLSGLADEYNSVLVNCGRVVRIIDPNGSYTAKARGIDAKGDLIVEKEDGTVTAVYAGEVSVRGVYGYV